jgi:acyl carrier protein
MSVDPELLERVRTIAAEVLCIEIEDAGPESNFFRDLGGESIDLLDLQFQVEKQLGIRLQLREMLASNEWAFDDEKRFTARTQSQLVELFPFLTSAFQSGALQTREDLFTIELISEFVALAARQSKTASV